ncbi:hypothetical protein AYI68_g2294 [Smittium mucronatum]|uniref:Uncharacterized protein n=1 Tax=Smittium mucronatum TaxID=133383 RepID=A0A1R0H356_9FUNG|nr:hypothetical protein AYI68_g2294 [Smittium mucronatum]
MHPPLPPANTLYHLHLLLFQVFFYTQTTLHTIILPRAQHICNIEFRLIRKFIHWINNFSPPVAHPSLCQQHMCQAGRRPDPTRNPKHDDFGSAERRNPRIRSERVPSDPNITRPAAVFPRLQCKQGGAAGECPIHDPRVPDRKPGTRHNAIHRQSNGDGSADVPARF